MVIIMITRWIAPTFLAITLLCSHAANAGLIRVSDGSTVMDLASETREVLHYDDNGILLGGYNFRVGTFPNHVLWDLAFIDGSYNDIFVDANGYVIPDIAALNDFLGTLNDILLGNGWDYSFKDSPNKIFGCEGATGPNDMCVVVQPVLEGGYGFGFMYEGYQGSWIDQVGPIPPQEGLDVDYTSLNKQVFAVWSRPSDRVVRDVPEPSTLAIFALGFMGLASRRFKKQPKLS